jgi:hypothetical protein
MMTDLQICEATSSLGHQFVVVTDNGTRGRIATFFTYDIARAETYARDDARGRNPAIYCRAEGSWTQHEGTDP